MKVIILGGSQLVKSPLPRHSSKVLLSAVLCLFWLKDLEELSQTSSPEMCEASGPLKWFVLGFESTLLSGANINTNMSEMGL